jgi:hypothetical protein
MPGNVVHNARWPEPVEIKLIEEFGQYLHTNILTAIVAVTGSSTQWSKRASQWPT